MGSEYISALQTTTLGCVVTLLRSFIQKSTLTPLFYIQADMFLGLFMIRE
ncbi:hypothetical protein ALT717_100162 [Alteromonas macleodii]